MAEGKSRKPLGVLMNGKMRIGLGFILEVPTAEGPLYVQWLTQDGERIGSLSDDPADAQVFRAEAVACDEGYVLIEPRLPGSIWEECHPVAVLEEVVPMASTAQVHQHRRGRFWQWFTWRRGGA
jgi:hypothetical protein